MSDRDNAQREWSRRVERWMSGDGDGHEHSHGQAALSTSVQVLTGRGEQLTALAGAGGRFRVDANGFGIIGGPMMASGSSMQADIGTSAVKSVVRQVVQLITLLAHHQDTVRVHAAELLFALAGVYERHVIEDKRADFAREVLPVLSSASSDDGRTSATVVETMATSTQARAPVNAATALFQLIATALAPLASALIAALECVPPSTHGRDLCVAAMAQLVHGNHGDILDDQEVVRIAWQLFVGLTESNGRLGVEKAIRMEVVRVCPCYHVASIVPVR